MSDPLVTSLRTALQQLGVADLKDAELNETPERFAELLREWFLPRTRPTMRPIAIDPTQRNLVVLRDIRFHALCAHHIVPFFGTVDIAYLPDEHIVGFGSLTRLVDELSRGPQLQERLVAAIADALQDDLAPRGLLVRMTARQMCVELTCGGHQPRTITLAGRGCYADDTAARALQVFTA